jgi:hypothetical protein
MEVKRIMTGEQLKSTRQELGLTQEELAELFRVEVEDIVQWERNEHALGPITGVLECAMYWVKYGVMNPSDWRGAARARLITLDIRDPALY